VYGIAWACTEREREAVFRQIGMKFSSSVHIVDVMAYLRHRSNEINMVDLIDSDVCCFSEILSNGAEQLNHAAGSDRAKGFLTLIMSFMFEKNSRAFFKRGQHATMIATALTPAVIAKITDDFIDAKVTIGCYWLSLVLLIVFLLSNMR
jgi:hypothetical protein